MMDLKDFFKKIILFESIDEDEIDFFLKQVKVKEFPPGAQIIVQGKSVEGLYVIQEGLAQVTLRLPGDRYLKIAQLAAGNFFGDVVLIHGGQAIATIETLEKTRCVLLNREVFQALQTLNPRIAYKLIVNITLQVIQRVYDGISRIAGVLNDIQEEVALTDRNLLQPVDVLSLEELHREKISLSFLKKLSVFQSYSLAELSNLIPYLKLVKLPNHYSIAKEEEGKDDSCYLIVQGGVGVTIKCEHAVTKLGVLGVGSMIVHQYGLATSEHELLIPTTYVTRESTILFKMEKQQLNKLYHEDFELYVKWCLSVSDSLVNLLRLINKQAIRYQSEFPMQSFLNTLKM